MPFYIVTATDTDVGKTLCSGLLLQKFLGYYIKPLQTGSPTDTATLKAWTQLPDTHFLPELYSFSDPVAPLFAAERSKTVIDPQHLEQLPEILKNAYPTQTIIIEGAGGLCVPITQKQQWIDFFAYWALPTILCARTTLGTINHTLLSLEAIHTRKIPLKGIFLIGPEQPETCSFLAQHSPILGYINPQKIPPQSTAQSIIATQNPFTDDFHTIIDRT